MSNPMAWGAWQALPDGVDPYLHWWSSAEGSSAYARAAFRTCDANALAPFTARAAGSENGPALTKQVFGTAHADGACAPVPLDSLNPDWSDDADWTPQAFIDRLKADTALGGGLEDIPDNAVLVAVIDTGIPLSHRRTRLANGSSRVIASWQQTARWDVQGQSYLPFGRELLRADIDQLLQDHSTGGYVDEEAFNRAAGLTEPTRGPGQGMRDLDFAVTHGAHILDLAAGFHPVGDFENGADRCRLLSVNLPPQFMHGTNGNFLQYFALLALERIVAVAEALWEAKFDGKKGRFPLLVNFSYGMHAGPKDGSQPFEQAARSLIHSYGVKGGLMRISMPSGNKNQDRATARLTPKKDAPHGVVWRVLPQDPTSNLAEIWTPAEDTLPGANRYTFELSPPGSTGLALPQRDPALIDETKTAFSDLTNAAGKVIARAYMRGHVVGSGADATRRLQTILCIPPTETLEPLDVAAAPAGGWTLSAQTSRSKRAELDVHLQVDQSAIAHKDTGKMSYFDDPDYPRFGKRGGRADAKPYPYDPTAPNTDTGTVRRRGTHNPIATAAAINMIGGYDATTGAPTKYSATTWDESLQDGVVPMVDAALPSEDSPGTFGILSAGARDGSVAAYRGTSMATALATRTILDALLEFPGAGVGGDSDWLGQQAQAFEAARPEQYENAAPAKVGYGRLPFPQSYRTGAVKRA